MSIISKDKKSARNLCAQTKRGDTIVEVMFAMAVFSFVAVLAISSMNLGLAKAEGTLELTTVRDELNAQAEAIRFVAQAGNIKNFSGSSTDTSNGDFTALWEEITSHAIVAGTAEADTNLLTLSKINACNEAYPPNTKLKDTNAFVLNIRDLQAGKAAYISVNNSADSDKFVPAPLSARIVYNNGSSNSDDDLDSDSENHNAVSRVEGIWDFAVKDENDKYYDFYIQACWNPPNSRTPTKLDTVIRIYNKN